MRTLPLDIPTWDLKLDAAGNWSAVNDVGQYVAQTTANAWLMFTNDSYFYPSEGIPYFDDVLGKRPPQALVEAHMKRMALNVPLVVKCIVEDVKFEDRILHADGYVFTREGEKYSVSF